MPPKPEKMKRKESTISTKSTLDHYIYQEVPSCMNAVGGDGVTGCICAYGDDKQSCTSSSFGYWFIREYLRMCMYSRTRVHLNLRRGDFFKYWRTLILAHIQKHSTQLKSYRIFYARSSLALVMIVIISANNILKAHHKELISPVSGSVNRFENQAAAVWLYNKSVQHLWLQYWLVADWDTGQVTKWFKPSWVTECVVACSACILQWFAMQWKDLHFSKF